MKTNTFEFPKAPAWPFPVTTKPETHTFVEVPFSAYEPTSPQTQDGQWDGDIGIVHIYNPDYPKGGMTIAYRKSNEYKSGVMVDVAVHVCSDADSFSKKIGNAGAKEKFLSGETIQLPILRIFVKEDISYAVKRAFTALSEAI